ncbi:MAG: MarR family winged helix-turn-helix transcriptional regulator, partial [Acidimicrobiales bacterium]
KCLGMGRASAGALIDDLEKRKLVDRKADPKDKRVWLVGLTDEGKELAAQLEQRDLDLRDLFREGVTREERSQLADVLQKFRANLNKVRKDHSKVDYKGE